MTTNLSPQGQVSLPASVRQQLGLTPGDDFEVAVEDGNTITLRRVTQPVNRGLVDLLLACPAPFDLPERSKDNSHSPDLAG